MKIIMLRIVVCASAK